MVDMKRDQRSLGEQALTTREGNTVVCPVTGRGCPVCWFNRQHGFGFVEDLANEGADDT